MAVVAEMEEGASLIAPVFSEGTAPREAHITVAQGSACAKSLNTSIL